MFREDDIILPILTHFLDPIFDPFLTHFGPATIAAGFKKGSKKIKKPSFFMIFDRLEGLFLTPVPRVAILIKLWPFLWNPITVDQSEWDV
jgi:hypothetical protein